MSARPASTTNQCLSKLHSDLVRAEREGFFLRDAKNSNRATVEEESTVLISPLVENLN